MRKETFEEGCYYHLYNRGVDHRTVFLDDRDRTRFVNVLYVLNNYLDVPLRFDILTLEPREHLSPIPPYVEIVAACLMPNHYHLMLTPKKKNGVSAFMHKIGTSYTKYFNAKYERTGALFEGSFRAKLVDRHEYATYLTQYIHLNPRVLIQAKLGSRKEEALKELENYPWSTLPDYLGNKSRFSIAVSNTFRNEVLDMSAKEYRAMVHTLYYESSESEDLDF